jgi:mRNA-degrading endonuclease YafQ of YafQ-DinJ toxin-antitoxin module
MVFRRTLPFMLAFCFALIPQSILAQQKIPIELKTISDDTVGKKLVDRIKDDIQLSAIFEITSDTNLPRLKITIVTLDPYKTGVSTIYSLLMVTSDIYFYDIFISSDVGVCGLGKINDIAKKIMADIEINTEFFKKAKKDWEDFGEVWKEEKQKLIEQINGLQNKTNELEEQLKTEKAKSWWKKLKETIIGKFYLYIFKKIYIEKACQ